MGHVRDAEGIEPCEEIRFAGRHGATIAKRGGGSTGTAGRGSRSTLANRIALCMMPRSFGRVQRPWGAGVAQG
jgi:hypothetical protein